MRTYTATGMLLAAALSLGTSAAAQVYNGSFSGTIDQGTDISGYFVAPNGGDLADRAIAGAFSYDIGRADYDAFGNYTSSDDAFFLSFALTIDTVTYTFKSFASTSTAATASFSNSPNAVNLVLQRSGIDNAGAQDEAVTVTFQPATLVGVTAQPFAALGDVGTFELTTSRASASGSFLIRNASVALADSAVPEPETWSQMILGLAMIGASMRFRLAVRRGRSAPIRA